jgi:hypothetical protein
MKTDFLVLGTDEEGGVYLWGLFPIGAALTEIWALMQGCRFKTCPLKTVCAIILGGASREPQKGTCLSV